MEEHHYGGSTGGGRGGGGAQDPSTGSAAARPNGWSSLTRQLRNPSPPTDPFPPLLVPTTTNSAENHHAQNQNHVPSNSGERSQQQRGVSSPASSAGSFSSNHSGRNHQRNHLADAQAAFSSNAADERGFLVAAAAGGSPPESSSGSFAPNSSLVNHHHHHHKRDRHRGNNNHSRGSAGPASSAGSFSLNPYPYNVQSVAYDPAALVGFRQQLGGSQDGGREREVTCHSSGGGKNDMQVDQQVNGYNSSSLKKREIQPTYELVVDEGRRDETSAAAAEIDDLDGKPAVSDGRSSIGDVDRDGSNGAHEQQGKDAGNSTAASSAFHVPMEPEWEEEDVYLQVRSDALKEARARDKFARGASQAYARGDHRKAKILSKQAEEKRLVAQRLHAEAATKILNQRDNEGSFDIWHLDLHGLHSSEAVAALESRLALLEHGVAEDHRLGAGSSAGPSERGGQEAGVLLEQKGECRDESGQIQQQGAKQKLFQSLIPSSKLLSIVTGVGAHSHGGPTLPSAVKSFLINNGYQLVEPRAGVVSVRPKLRFSV